MKTASTMLTISIALILSFTIIAVCLAFSGSIYSGKLVDYLPYGTAFTLAGSGVVIVLIALYSGIPIAVGRPQDEPLPIIILMVQTIALQFNSGTAGILTVLASISMATIVTGCLLFAFGWLKLGRFVRFIPFSVVAGFLASSGLLLIFSAFHQVFPLGQMLSHVWDTTYLLLWLPTLLFAVILFVISERFEHPLLFPGAIVTGFVLFYLCYFFSAEPFSALKAANLLPDVHGITLKGMGAHFSELQPVDWGILMKNFGMMLVIGIVSVIALLFITMSLELVLRKDIDFNKELKVAGVANIMAGCVGGIVGYHALGNTVFSEKFKISGRNVGIFCGLACFVSVLFLDKTLAYFPRFMLIGLVLFLGGSLFYKWTFCVRGRLSLLDKAVVLTVLFVTVVFGFLSGMIAGIVVAMAFFIFTYSRINVVRYVLDGRELTSAIERDALAQKILKTHGKKIVYFKLNGYLFFGSAYALVQQLRDLDAADGPGEMQFVLYDLEQVTGIDSSVELSFEKIHEYAKDKNYRVILTGVAEHKNKPLWEKISSMNFSEYFFCIPNSDAAIEYCESHVLKEADYDVVELENQAIALEDFLGDKSLKDTLSIYFENMELQEGEFLFHRHDLSHDLFYLESGRLVIFIDTPGGGRKILTRIGPGNFIGEVAFYLHSSRSASTLAEKPCRLRKLSQRNFKKMKKESVELAEVFSQTIICLLSEKLVNTTKKIELLSK